MTNWKNIFTVLGWLGFTGCLIIIIYLDRPEAPGQIIEKSTIKIYDSTKKFPPPKLLPVQVFSYTVPVLIAIDTQAVLSNYFAVHVFQQVFQDSTYRATIIDTISQNRIRGRVFSYQQLRPVKTIESTTVTAIENNFGFYLGAETEASNNFYGIGPRLSYLTKKNLLLNTGYDLINRSFKFGVQFRIHAGNKH